MIKPNDYDNVKAYGEYNRLPNGGYVCRIIRVDETKSKNSKDMIKIGLDIAEGLYAGFYAADFNNNPKTDKKWGCVVNQLVYDNEGHTNRGLKTFHEAVEKSNPGFAVQWGDNYAAAFRGKLVGGLFRREEYQKMDGNYGWITRCYSFRTIDAIKNGKFDMPEDKPLNFNNGDSYMQGNNNSGNVEYTVENSASDDDLPF